MGHANNVSLRLLSSSVSWDYENLKAVSTSCPLIIHRYLRTGRSALESVMLSLKYWMPQYNATFSERPEENPLFLAPLSQDPSECLVMRCSACIFHAVVSTDATTWPIVGDISSKILSAIMTIKSAICLFSPELVWSGLYTVIKIEQQLFTM